MKKTRQRIDVNLDELDRIIDHGTHAPLSESASEECAVLQNSQRRTDGRLVYESHSHVGVVRRKCFRLS
jgi:hypothetical protein